MSSFIHEFSFQQFVELHPYQHFHCKKFPLPYALSQQVAISCFSLISHAFYYFSSSLMTHAFQFNLPFIFKCLNYFHELYCYSQFHVRLLLNFHNWCHRNHCDHSGRFQWYVRQILIFIPDSLIYLKLKELSRQPLHHLIIFLDLIKLHRLACLRLPYLLNFSQ